MYGIMKGAVTLTAMGVEGAIELVDDLLTDTAAGWCIRAVKDAVVVDADKELYGGIFVGGEYGPIATAVCSNGGGHASPYENCTCGFHALDQAAHGFRGLGRSSWSRQEVEETIGLDVLLTGRIIVADYPGGRLFRAEHQLVLDPVLDIHRRQKDRDVEEPVDWSEELTSSEVVTTTDINDPEDRPAGVAAFVVPRGPRLPGPYGRAIEAFHRSQIRAARDYRWIG